MKKHILSLIFSGTLCCLAFNGWAQATDNKNSSANTAQKTPVKIIEFIPGNWVIEHVYKGKKDVISTDTLAANQILEFNREGRYTSFSGTERVDSGAYRLNEDHGILYMASNTNDTPVEWNIWFDKQSGNMTLKKKVADKHTENLTYVYRRSGTATSSNRK